MENFHGYQNLHRVWKTLQTASQSPHPKILLITGVPKSTAPELATGQATK